MTVKTQDLRSRKKKLVLDRIIFFFLWFSFFFLTSTKQFRRRLLQTVDLKNELTTTYWAFPFKRASIAHRPIYFNETINPKKKEKNALRTHYKDLNKTRRKIQRTGTKQINTMGGTPSKRN